MDSTLLFILVVGGFGAVVLVAWLRSRTITNGNASNPPDWVLGAAPESTQMPQNAETEMHRMLAQGKKIEAIKIVREHTGLGLKEAKEYVEAVAAGKNPAPAMQMGEMTMPTGQDKVKLEGQVRQLLAGGNKIAAVKLVREYTQWGLKEAKDYVDAIELGAQPATPPPQTGASTFRLDEKDLERQARQLVAAGKKIEAVKLVREHTGWGLKESKDFVDRLG